MIAGLPQIVIAPTPTTGLANSLASGSSNNPFSSALQAATQNLLHPSLKSKNGATNPSPKAASTQSSNGDPASGNSSLQTLSPNLLNPATVANPPIVPAAVLPQPGTMGEANLQATTLGAEQKQSAAQSASMAAIGTQTAPFAQTGPLQFGAGATGGTSSGTNVLSGPQAPILNPASPELPQTNPKGIPLNNPPAPKQQPQSGIEMLSVAASKKEPAPVTGFPNASSPLTSQPAAHATKAAQQPVSPAPSTAGNATASTNETRSTANPPEHSGLTNENKNQTTQAAETSTTAASSVPQIPLQSVVPDINVIKLSPKPAEALQTTPGLAAGSAASGVQPATEISKKNGDSSGSLNAQSGAGKSNASSFASVSANSQPADNSGTPATSAGNISSSTTLVGSQVAHAVAGANDALGTSAKASATTAEASQTPTNGTPEADARVQAAATYANSLLHSARLVERMGQTELRVGIQAGEFGNVDIRTSMVRNQFTAQISVERGELGKVLAAELPSLQNRLSDQRLPMANITLQNQSGGGSAGSGQESRQSQTMQQLAISQISEGDQATILPGLTEANTSAGRLDVHM